MWKSHYGELLNSCQNTECRDFVDDRLKTVEYDTSMIVTIDEVINIIKGLSKGKSAGMDGLNGESLIYADNRLSLLLWLCFTCMFKHSFIPNSMLNSVIVPLVKNKCGDLSDKNNYRPIACLVLYPRFSKGLF